MPMEQKDSERGFEIINRVRMIRLLKTDLRLLLWVVLPVAYIR